MKQRVNGKYLRHISLRNEASNIDLIFRFRFIHRTFSTPDNNCDPESRSNSRMASSMSDPKLKAISKTTFTRKEVSASLMRLLCRLNYRSPVRRSNAERSGRALWNVALASDYIRCCTLCLHAPKPFTLPAARTPSNPYAAAVASLMRESIARPLKTVRPIVSGDLRRARGLSKSSSRSAVEIIPHRLKGHLRARRKARYDLILRFSSFSRSVFKS